MADHEEPIAPRTVSPAPAPRRVPTAVKPPSVPIFPVLLFILFLAAIAASVYAERAMKPAPTAAPAADATKPAEASKADDAAKAAKPGEAAPASASASADDVKAIKAEIAALTARVDAMPKAEPAPDVKPLQEKVDSLAKTVAEAPRKLPDEVAAKLTDAEKNDAAMKGELDALKAEIASMKDAMKARPAPVAEAAQPAAAPAAGVDAAAMTAAVDLFKANKFAEALAAFKKLPADDARVLYYTALSTGLSTSNWKGDTEATVLKGVDREKAGSPAKGDIDAAMAPLTKEQKAWLDAYRARAK